MQSINSKFENDYTINALSYRVKINYDYAIAIVSAVLLGLSAITQNQFYVIALCAFIPVGIIKPIYITPIYYVSSLSSQYFMAAEGIGLTRVFALAIFVGVFLRNFFGEEVLERTWIRYLIYIASTTIISFIFANHQYPQILLTVGMNLMIVLTFANMRFTGNEIHRLFKSIFLGVAIITTTIFLNAILNPSIISDRVTLTDELNANTFAIMTSQLAAFLFGYALYTKNKLEKIVSIILVTLTVFLVLVSGSRTNFIALIMGILTTVFIFKNIKNEKLKGILLIAILSIIANFIFTKVVQQFPALSYRFTLDSVISSGGTGRWERIVAELKYVIPQNLFFGVGPVSINETIALEGLISFPGSSHNILISMLTQIGLVGSVGYILFVYGILKKLIKNCESISLSCIPICLIMTGIFTGIGEVVYHERFFWSALALGILCISANHINSEKEI